MCGLIGRVEIRAAAPEKNSFECITDPASRTFIFDCVVIKEISMRTARVLMASIAALLVPLSAYAQYQPGSTGYNTVVVPGNALGKEATRSPNRWGAFSLGTGGKFGWSMGARTEEEAKRMAQDDCARNGSPDCSVEKTFVNTCGALAWGVDNWTTSFAPPRKSSLRDLELEALSRCGTECTIIRSGCSL